MCSIRKVLLLLTHFKMSSVLETIYGTGPRPFRSIGGGETLSLDPQASIVLAEKHRAAPQYGQKREKRHE